MASQLEAGLESCSHATRATIEELHRHLASIDARASKIEENAKRNAEAMETRIAGEVSVAAGEMEAAVGRCMEAVEAQKDSFESFSEQVEGWKGSLDARLREQVEDCSRAMETEVAGMQAQFATRLQEETATREAKEAAAEREAARIEKFHAVAAEEATRLAQELRGQVGEVERRVGDRVAREAEWLRGEIQDCGEAVAEQAAALKLMCTQAGIQFRSGASAVRAASPTRERPHGHGRLSPVSALRSL